MTTKPRKVRCPQCGGDAVYSSENPWRPFCSERCKQIDLGAWANESYRIAGKVTDDETGSSDFDFQDSAKR